MQSTKIADGTMLATRKVRNSCAGSATAITGLEPEPMYVAKPGSSDASEMDRNVVNTAGIKAAITIAATEVRTRIGPSNASDMARPSSDNGGKRLAGARPANWP